MTQSKFKKWLNEKIAFVGTLEETKYPGVSHYEEDIIDEAYRTAAELGLSESVKACMHGPPLVRLMNCLKAIPVPERDLYPIGEAAQLLGVHRTTLKRRAEDGEIDYVLKNGRKFFTKKQLAGYQRPATPGTLFG